MADGEPQHRAPSPSILDSLRKTFARDTSPRIKQFALEVGLVVAWAGSTRLDLFDRLTAVLQARLTNGERQGLAWAALRACSPDEAHGIAEDVIPPAVMPRTPPPSWFDEETFSDAADWADQANPLEVHAYAVALLDRMSPAERAEIFKLYDRKAVA